MADNQDALISQFVTVTGATVDQATEYLNSNDWDIATAVSSYFRDSTGELESAEGAPAPAAAGGSQPPTQPSGSSSAAFGRPSGRGVVSKAPAKKKGLATLSSLNNARDEEDDDEDEDYSDEDEASKPRDLFAGGEKSGLAVQDPAQQATSSSKKLIQDIIQQAKSNASQARGEQRAAGPSAPAAFRGSGQTLGGDGVESRVIPGASSSSRTTRSQASSSQPGGQQPEGDLQERFLHLWNDGFSIDDGPLHRFDDPRNRQDLDMIRNGRAPLHLMNVRLDQPVDVKLQQHHEDWHQLPKIYRPFGGEGRRLGSPVPGDGVAAAPAAPAATANTGASSSSASAATPSTQVDDSQPTVTLRIQLPDGTRLPARFNTTQTVGDVYDFIGRASPATQGRPWVLATTFPNKDHTEKDLVLGDVPEFKRGGTAVVKWA